MSEIFNQKSLSQEESTLIQNTMSQFESVTSLNGKVVGFVINSTNLSSHKQNNPEYRLTT